MNFCNVVEIVTPKKVLLNGLWFGPQKSERTIIWIHGLGSSAFSRLGVVEKLVSDDTAVLTFNNRGHDFVSSLGKISGKKRTLAGAAYEKFEECVDDVQGAIDFAKAQGAKEIYLVGHSTGCQKAVYWAYKNANKSGKGVKGIILLAPVSDYAGAVKKYGLPKIRKLVTMSRALLKSGKGDDLLSQKIWAGEPDTPRRFISLYTPDSVEQSIFSHFEPNKKAKILSAVRVPILAILAEKDEFADRSAGVIVQWFETHTRAPLQSLVAKGATHGFKEVEDSVAKAMTDWILRKIKTTIN